MRKKHITFTGLVLGLLMANSAAAWEEVRWPATICGPIDPSSARNLIYGASGKLSNFSTWETSWVQCPVRTPTGLGLNEFVTWSADLLHPMREPCVLRVASEQGELLQTQIVRAVDFVDPNDERYPQPGFVKFDWQPRAADASGVYDTSTAIVRCEFPTMNSYPPGWWGGTGIASVVGPGDGDTARHNWPGTMCRPKLLSWDANDPEQPTGADDILYNSGGAVANMSTTNDYSVVCPIPVPSPQNKRGASIHVEVNFLSEAPRLCRLAVFNTSNSQDGQTVFGLHTINAYQPDGKLVTIDADVPGFEYAGEYAATVTCSLQANGGFGPSGITSYVTQVDLAPLGGSEE